MCHKKSFVFDSIFIFLLSELHKERKTVFWGSDNVISNQPA